MSVQFERYELPWPERERWFRVLIGILPAALVVAAIVLAATA